MEFLEPKSSDERLNRKIDAENLRRLQIENDLRSLFGRGSIAALFFVLGGILLIVVLLGLGILSFPVAPIWIFVPLLAFFGVLTAIVRRLFNTVK